MKYFTIDEKQNLEVVIATNETVISAIGVK